MVTIVLLKVLVNVSDALGEVALHLFLTGARGFALAFGKRAAAAAVAAAGAGSDFIFISHVMFSLLCSSL
jgi:hypothetical protein